jgi:adenylate cyclase
MAKTPVAGTAVDEREEKTVAATPINDPIQAALEADKREGLHLAVKARWAALVIIAPFLVYLNPTWPVLYYEALLAGLALIGWAQIKVGRLGKSRAELILILCDLALMTFALVVPNPFVEGAWPVAMQYRFDSFIYFFVLLAGATMAYSWRTILGFGLWTSGLWIAGMIWALLQPAMLPEVSAKIQSVLASHPKLLDFLDPNDVHVAGRIQEILVFMIVAGTLALSGRRTNRLLRRQAEVARERANLARYFPPNIVDQLADRDQPLGAVREQNVAIMFVDIVGFTKFAEGQTAVEIVGMLRQFHARAERVVFDHGGTLDKFLGDGLMATFGTPQSTDHDASNALTCAHAMLTTMQQWNPGRKSAGGEEIKVSIGLHYGAVVLGDIGSERRLEFAVLGDAVNVASRLEGLTRTLDVQLAIGDGLVSAVRRESIEPMRSLLAQLTSNGPQILRGRDEEVVVWTL